VAIPAGEFMMGTADDKRVLNPRSGKLNTNESPQHRVAFSRPFAISKYEITLGQFKQFVLDSGYEPAGGCIQMNMQSMKLNEDSNTIWRNPGFVQADDEPVVCVSYQHASAYADWLSRKTGARYHVPTEAQWEYVTRAGSQARFFWSDDPNDACDFANVKTPAEQSTRNTGMTADDKVTCDDGFNGIAAVGHYRPNAFGVHDMLGNVWEWVIDCNHHDYAGAPVDGSAWLDDPQCRFRIIRGGSYSNPVTRSGSAIRAGRPQNGMAPNLGFRVARSDYVDPASLAATQAAQVPAESAALTGGDAEGARLFREHCSACHVDATTFKGVYGKDLASIENTIRTGGNNTMSMPNFGGTLSDEVINQLAAYVWAQKGWD